MDSRDAAKKVDQILDEERILPTVGYHLARAPGSSAVLKFSSPLGERGEPFRTVQEHPDGFVFKSANFDLLRALLDQVSKQDTAVMLAALLARIASAESYRRKSHDVRSAGKWQMCSSELPLVAEFVIRRGEKASIIRALNSAALSPGLTLLLVQLDEMIALNFTLFTEKEYAHIRKAMGVIKKATTDFDHRRGGSSTVESNINYNVCREIPAFCESVMESCRKAQFLYLKGELLAPGVNLEVNQDKDATRTFLEELGFDQLLIQSLEEAERLYRTAEATFDLKSGLGHLRSFLEQLHIQTCAKIPPKAVEPLPSKWGNALRYLQENGLLTKQEESFGSQLYTLMSDAGVHPLIAEREYARLMRNMSIEYGLLLLTKLAKLRATQRQSEGSS